MAFSNNLRYLRKKNGWSQDALAEKLGYKSFTTIQKWESGVSEPSVSMVQTIASLFDISMDELVNGDLSVSSDEVELIHNPFISRDEEELLLVYRGLNLNGKKLIEDYADIVSSSGKYNLVDRGYFFGEDEVSISLVKESPYNAVAAHERTDIEVTDEMRKFDDDIMSDEDF